MLGWGWGQTKPKITERNLQSPTIIKDETIKDKADSLKNKNKSY